MRLAASNIAWPPAFSERAYALLQSNGFAGLEVAPGLILPTCPDPFEPTASEVREALARTRHYGLTLVSMQSLLFGVDGAALFLDEVSRERLERALERAIGLAQRLEIPNLVFGSPRQRAYPPSMDDAQAESIALDVFRRLGDRALVAGTRLAIEPNGRAYGTNFLNRVEEAAAFVRHADHPGIVLNFDIGALHMEGDFDRVAAIVSDVAPWIGHVHVSEPQLAPAPADPAQAAVAFKALSDACYTGWHSIEMAATGQPLDDLATAVANLKAAAALAGLGVEA